MDLIKKIWEREGFSIDWDMVRAMPKLAIGLLLMLALCAPIALLGLALGF
jgi:hypothetical protein